MHTHKPTGTDTQTHTHTHTHTLVDHKILLESLINTELL